MYVYDRIVNIASADGAANIIITRVCFSALQPLPSLRRALPQLSEETPADSGRQPRSGRCVAISSANLTLHSVAKRQITIYALIY